LFVLRVYGPYLKPSQTSSWLESSLQS